MARLYDTVAVVAGSVDAVAPPPHVRDRVLAATRTPGRYTLAASVDDWFDTPFPGIRGRVLAVDRGKGMATLFLRAEPGAIYPAHDHQAPRNATCCVARS